MDDGRARDHLNIFISYARQDGLVHAKRFAEELSRSPRFSATYDARFRRDQGFDRSIEAAISSADVMIVVLTDAVAEKEWVRREILYAHHLNRRRQRVRLIVAQMTKNPGVPVGIIELPRINFATEPDAWAQLQAALVEESGPEYGARPYLAGADDPRDGRHTVAAHEAAARAREERRRAADPLGAQSRLHQRVRADWQREGGQDSPVRRHAAIEFVNEMPDLPEIEFQDRIPAMTALDEALHRPAVRLGLITGDGGTGKTAFLREYRRKLADQQFTAPAAGFVYLAVRGYRQVSAAAFLDDLARLAPDHINVRRVLRQKLPWRDRLDAVLRALDQTPAIVAIDDADGILDERGQVRDRDLRAIVTELVTRPGHQVRILMVVGRDRAAALRRTFGDRVEVCDLSGLPTPHTVPFLTELDADRLLVIGDMPEKDLDLLGVISDGNPRFLELTYCLLRSDPDLTLAGMFQEIAARRDDGMREPFPLLIDAVLARLGRTDRRVIQALAVYGRPVRPAAVDHLLAPYVPGLDSAPVLETLAVRHLVRRDGDRYFLPPNPDARCVLEAIPAGRADDWRSVEPVFALPVLRRRAADYYALLGQALDVRGPDDLQPHLNQIELLIAAGDYAVAVELMESIDDDYLTRWGQSGVLIRWREEVDAKIEKRTRSRATNMSYLVSALSGEADHTGRWTARLHEVLSDPWIAKAPNDRIRFGIQLADLQQDNGDLVSAAALYDESARKCRTKTMHYEAAMARIGRGACLARMGDFAGAGREFSQVRRWLPTVGDDGLAEVTALLCLNEGWLLGQLGTGHALKVLEDGLDVARNAGDLLLTGRLLDGLAALHCDSKKIDNALPCAVEAAEIAIRTGHQALSRNANVTLALAYLLDGQVANAAAAIETAAQQPPGLMALAARTVEGVVHFRLGDLRRATTAFHAACTEAWLRLDRAPREYSVYDAAGLAFTGLELCGEAYRLPRAIDMYAAARRIAPVKGARRRSTAQLALFEPVTDRTTLEVATRAADGD